MPPLAVLVAVPPLLLFLAVCRRAEARRRARLFRAQGRWAEALDRERWQRESDESQGFK
jgi:hypothetical protein